MGRFWLLIAVVAIACFITTSLLAISLFHYKILVRDDWLFYQRFLNNPFWSSIWDARNGHRLFFPGLLDKLNILIFHDNLTNLVTINVFSLIASGWMLACIGIHNLHKSHDRVLLVAINLAVLLWLGNRFALVFAFGTTYTLGIFGAVATCFFLFRASRCKGIVYWAWLIAALLAGTVASYSWGSGIVIWPILLLMGLCLEVSRPALLAILITGVTAILAYLSLLPAGNHPIQILIPATASQLPSDIWRILVCMGNMPGEALSGYVGETTHGVAWFSGFTGLAALAGIANLIRLWWLRKHECQWLIPLVGSCLFVVGTAALIGIERGWAFKPDQLVIRYRIFSSLLWSTLITAYLIYLVSRSHSFAKKYSTTILALLIIVLLAPSQIKGFNQLGKWSAVVNKATLSLVSGNPDTKLIHWVFTPHTNAVENVYPYLLGHRLTIFRRPWAHWPGTRLPGCTNPTRTIQGSLPKQPEMTEKRHGRIKGWLARPHRNALILAVDKKGFIRGIAMPLLSFSSVRKRGMAQSYLPSWLQALSYLNPDLPAMLGWGRKWSGYLAPGVNTKGLRYFLVKRNKDIIGQIKP